jgi:hypothetical protein
MLKCSNRYKEFPTWEFFVTLQAIDRGHSTFMQSISADWIRMLERDFQLGNSSQHRWDFSAQAGADHIRALARIPNLGILRNTLGISQRGP